MLTATLERTTVMKVLRRFAYHYVGERRTAGELRTRLVAIEQERARCLAAAAVEDPTGHAERDLAEAERVAGTLARSTNVTMARLRGLEAVIAAVAVAAATELAPPPEPDDPDVPKPVARPDAALRGGWSAPLP
jgi:hypothetical protein